MPRALTPLVLAVLLTAACGDRKAPTPSIAEPTPADTKTDRDRPAAVKQPTELPEARPSPFEAEYRVRSEGDDGSIMLKLTEQGIRYSMGSRTHRVVLTYAGDTTALDRVYDALRDAAFDRIETRPSREMTRAGTSVRMLAGTHRHSVSDMGSIYPKDIWAAEYDAATKALESLLPKGGAPEAPHHIAIHWDESMKDRNATVDLPLGDAFAGVQQADGGAADVRIDLRTPEPITVKLRHGPPTKASDHVLDPEVSSGFTIAFDEEQDAPVLRLVPRRDGTKPGG